MSKVLCGQKVITPAGTAVTLGSGTINGPVLVKVAGGRVAIGNNGYDTISGNSGFILNSGEYVTFNEVGRLEQLYAIAEINNSKVCWTVLNF